MRKGEKEKETPGMERGGKRAQEKREKLLPAGVFWDFPGFFFSGFAHKSAAAVTVNAGKAARGKIPIFRGISPKIRLPRRKIPFPPKISPFPRPFFPRNGRRSSFPTSRKSQKCLEREIQPGIIGTEEKNWENPISGP